METSFWLDFTYQMTVLNLIEIHAKTSGYFSVSLLSYMVQKKCCDRTEGLSSHRLLTRPSFVTYATRDTVLRFLHFIEHLVLRTCLMIFFFFKVYYVSLFASSDYFWVKVYFVRY